MLRPLIMKIMEWLPQLLPPDPMDLNIFINVKHISTFVISD